MVGKPLGFSEDVLQKSSRIRRAWSFFFGGRLKNLLQNVTLGDHHPQKVFERETPTENVPDIPKHPPVVDHNRINKGLRFGEPLTTQLSHGQDLTTLP